MGLSTALGTALSGLHSTQVGIGVVSQNVANAGTAGYVRRTVSNVDTVSGRTVGAGNPNVQRLLDRIVQHQLWQETSGAAYTSARAEVFSDLDQLYGAPGSATALDAIYNTFTSSLQALQNDPSSYTNRTAVLDAASQLASRLRGLSEGVQTQRSQTETKLDVAVDRVNELLGSLTDVNARIVNGGQSSATAELRDQRERIISELAQYVEIRTEERPNGAISISTASGTQLFDGRPTVTFEFDARSSIGPQSQWSADPAQRSVGTITARDISGNSFDAIANGTFRSGEIGALIELRDKTLVQAQAQLDEIAAQLSSALSDREIAGTAATVGAATGFDVDLAGLQSGNSVTLDYKVTPGGQTQRFTFVRVDSAASLPLPASAQGDANNRVVGIDFSGGMASVAAQIQAAVGAGFTVSNTGSVLRVVDDGAGATRDVVGLTARPTQTSLTGGTSELPFFVDAGRNNAAYTGRLCLAHHRQSGSGRRPLAPRRLQHGAGDAAGRHDTAEIPARPADLEPAQLHQLHRLRRLDRDLDRDDLELRPAGRRLAGPGQRAGPASRRGPAGGARLGAEPLPRGYAGQCRPGNVDADRAPERLRRQCTRYLHGQGVARRAAETVRR
jgi:flagellar hook-associated protein 1 FlgK